MPEATASSYVCSLGVLAPRAEAAVDELPPDAPPDAPDDPERYALIAPNSYVLQILKYMYTSHCTWFRYTSFAVSLAVP